MVKRLANPRAINELRERRCCEASSKGLDVALADPLSNSQVLSNHIMMDPTEFIGMPKTISDPASFAEVQSLRDVLLFLMVICN